MFYAHRLVALHFIPNPNDLPVVNHIDGNKLNNKIDNLEWTTYSDNTEKWQANKKVKTHSKTLYYTEDLENEVWKEYGNYLVSSLGRIRNKKRNNLLKPSITCGYYKVRLSCEGIATDWMVHKLVYALFNNDFDFGDKNIIIDHIDGDKLNNNIDNLRKITLSKNANAAYYEQKTNSSAKKVRQLTLDGEFIKDFASIAMASRELGLDGSTISKVCRGINKTHGGFIFKYIE